MTTEDALTTFRQYRSKLREAEAAYWSDPPEQRWERFNAEAHEPMKLFLTDSHKSETEPAEYERRRLVALGYHVRQVAMLNEIREQEQAMSRLRAEYQIAAVQLAEIVAAGAA